MQIEVTLAETSHDGEDDGYRVTASVETEVALTPEYVRDFLKSCGDEALRAWVAACERAETP